MSHEDRKLAQKWEPMRLTLLGKVGEIVQGGGGKISATGGDPGEPLKQPPTG